MKRKAAVPDTDIKSGTNPGLREPRETGSQCQNVFAF